MHRNRNRLAAAAGAAVAAGAIAVSGLTAATAAPVVRTAVSGTEHFQAVTTSGSTNTYSVIATGAFTAGGTDHEGKSAATEVFPGGTFKIAHSKGVGPQTFNPQTCLLTVSKHGTYTLEDGTGMYKGISGHGTYKLSILFVAARSQGKCSNKKPPLAFQLTIRASGPVHL